MDASSQFFLETVQAYSAGRSEIRFDAYMGDRAKYWEGKANFAPTGSAIEVFVDGSSDDEMEQQHEFFQRVLRDWSALREDIGRKLLDKWREHTPKTPIDSPWDRFTVSSMTIPKVSMHDAEWEISFVNSSDPDHLWTVSMKGGQPQKVSVDG